MVNRKLWCYVPAKRRWLERWLRMAVEHTDLGLTRRGEPRVHTTSNWLWSLVESVLSERYYGVRKALSDEKSEAIEIDVFLQGNGDNHE